MLLEVQGIRAAYGENPVLFGVSFSMDEGSVLSLIGRNGMGKSTTVKCLTGLLATTGGSIVFKGRRIDAQPSFRIARIGMALVPEGRRIFPNLTVRENLMVGWANRDNRTDPWTLTEILDFFPPLKERLNYPGTRLSGGEQQMLAIGRALATNPSLLILDEATEGLAPLVREEIWSRLRRLKSRGVGMIVIDKDTEALSSVADTHIVMEKGEVVWTGDTGALHRDANMLERFIGV